MTPKLTLFRVTCYVIKCGRSFEVKPFPKIQFYKIGQRQFLPIVFFLPIRDPWTARCRLVPGLVAQRGSSWSVFIRGPLIPYLNSKLLSDQFRSIHICSFSRQPFSVALWSLTMYKDLERFSWYDLLSVRFLCIWHTKWYDLFSCYDTYYS